MQQPEAGRDLSIPLASETAVVRKAVVETSTVRIATHVEEHQELIRASLTRDDVVVERVPRGEVVQTAPQVRMEGDVLIFPVVEEVLFVETRLILKEELRITRRALSEVVEREVTLRRERADIQRSPVEPF